MDGVLYTGPNKISCHSRGARKNIRYMQNKKSLWCDIPYVFTDTWTTFSAIRRVWWKSMQQNNERQRLTPHSQLKTANQMLYRRRCRETCWSNRRGGTAERCTWELSPWRVDWWVQIHALASSSPGRICHLDCDPALLSISLATIQHREKRRLIGQPSSQRQSKGPRLGTPRLRQ